MVKNLMVGQSTYIKSNYVDDQKWEYNTPCIIATNNIGLIKFLMRSPEFNTQINLIATDYYLGEPGTKVEEMEKKDFLIQPNLEHLFEDDEIIENEFLDKATKTQKKDPDKIVVFNINKKKFDTFKKI